MNRYKDKWDEGDFKMTKDQDLEKAVKAAKEGDSGPLADLMSKRTAKQNEAKAKEATKRIRSQRSDYQPEVSAHDSWHDAARGHDEEETPRKLSQR